MGNNNDTKFKLITRRYLAMIGFGVGIVTLSFVVIWSLVKGPPISQLGSMALGGLISLATSVGVFYFGKKVAEE